MPVEIQELTTSVTVVDPQALLTPAVLEQVIQAVLQRLEARDRETAARRTELDLRSVVQQQRDEEG